MDAIRLSILIRSLSDLLLSITALLNAYRTYKDR